MKLDFIDLSELSIINANMRYAKKAPDGSELLPTVRARGVLVPLIVRLNGGHDSFEIVASARRFTAAKAVADERGGAGEPLPCAILEQGDDAAAIEESLIENIARIAGEEVTRWETFAKRVKEGSENADISEKFGKTGK